jgi:Tol biopolymer transport system component
MARRSLGILLFGVLIVLASVGASGAPSQSGSNLPESLRGSRVYWSQFENPPPDFDTLRIVSANPQGQHLRVLTHPALGVQDVDAKVSPDGSRVLFHRELPNDGGSVIGLINAKGNVRMIRPPCSGRCRGTGSPTWMPDGRHMIYNKDFNPIVNGNLSASIMYKSDLWGRHPIRFSPPGVEGVFEDNHPTFAPAGYVVFTRYSIARDKVAAFRMNRDKSHVRRLTPWSLDADIVSVSPSRNGHSRDLVVFETYGSGPPDGLAQAVATVTARSACRPVCTGHINYLTSPKSQPVQHFNPTWSPDGKQIAYTRFSFDENDTPQVRGDIWRMRWNGTGKAPVSRSPVLFDFRPSWGW